MKISFRAFIAAAVAIGLFALRAIAQDAPASPAPQTNASPATAQPATEKKAAPAKKATTKPAAKPVAKKAEPKPEPKLEPVLQPEPGVTKQSNVNVRGQASINSEVITRLKKNDSITILEAITLKKPKQDEPAGWYRIALPTNVAVWVNTSYIDPATKTVKPRKLNLRGGPGENFSIVGRMEKGVSVNPIDTKGDWTKIETPTNAFGFVAAHLVERTPAPAIVSAPAPVATPTNPPPVVAEVTSTTTPAVPTNPVTPAVATPPTTTPPPVAVTAPVEVAPDAPIEKVKKIVSREGILKGSVSIQAPTYFELRSLDTGRTINYVFSPSANLDLKQFKGKRILVTGEELLDERWQNTPVLIVDALQTVP
jgi:uncharacterized protein YgiM (DUF1202 family)